MSVRPRGLAPGWYPAGGSQTLSEIRRFEAELPAATERTALAAVAPHAGWSFSGDLAFQALRGLREETETVVVVGGHLAPRQGVMAAFEDSYETPLGALAADLDLLRYLRERMSAAEDRSPDNTVEIQLPLVRHLFPEAMALGLRVAPSPEALKLGEILAEYARREGRRLAVVGSTDLTHYGPNYGWSPKGAGVQAAAWVRDVNDRRLIDALLSMDFARALELAGRDRSACSAGAAAAAGSFAAAMGAVRGELLRYKSSFEVMPGDSFVGYAAIIFPGNG